MDKNHRLSYSMFMDDDGILKPEFIEMFGEAWTYEDLKADRGAAAIALGRTLLKLLPYSIPFNMKDDLNLSEIADWMGANVHDAWQLTMRSGEACFIFARDVDAIHFKMAWT